MAKALRMLAAAVVAALLAGTLFGCGAQSEETSTSVDVTSASYIYGLPLLPAAQGMIELSASRAASVLENFKYREHEGEGQWTDDLAAFDVLDNGTQATLEKESSSGTGGWVLMLDAYEDSAWSNCTLEEIEAGKDPARAIIIVFPQRGIVFEDAYQAVEVFTELFSGKIGGVVIDSNGLLVCGIARNVSGAVCEIVQEDPGTFRLTLHTKSQWEDSTYDEVKEACKKQGEADGCEYHDFHIEVPLFEEQKIVVE